MLRPDLRNGRGIGWALPLLSMVRQEMVYFPGAMPFSSVAQWAMVAGRRRGPTSSADPRPRTAATIDRILPGGSTSSPAALAIARALTSIETRAVAVAPCDKESEARVQQRCEL